LDLKVTCSPVLVERREGKDAHGRLKEVESGSDESFTVGSIMLARHESYCASHPAREPLAYSAPLVLKGMPFNMMNDSIRMSSVRVCNGFRKLSRLQ